MTYRAFKFATVAALLSQTAPAFAAVCDTAATAGTYSASGTDLTVEVRNYAAAANSYQLFVRGRASDTCLVKDASLAKYYFVPKPGSTKQAFSAGPGCGSGSSDWNSATVALQNGQPQTDGSTRYIGRVPFTIYVISGSMEMTTRTKKSMTCDYAFTVKADGTASQLCVDTVNSANDSSLWAE